MDEIEESTIKNMYMQKRWFIKKKDMCEPRID